MAALKQSVDVLNPTMIQSRTKAPYTTHNTTPVEWMRNMESERSATERVRTTRTTCGKKDTVVPVPAAKPTALIKKGKKVKICI